MLFILSTEHENFLMVYNYKARENSLSMFLFTSLLTRFDYIFLSRKKIGLQNILLVQIYIVIVINTSYDIINRLH